MKKLKFSILISIAVVGIFNSCDNNLFNSNDSYVLDNGIELSSEEVKNLKSMEKEANGILETVMVSSCRNSLEEMTQDDIEAVILGWKNLLIEEYGNDWEKYVIQEQGNRCFYRLDLKEPNGYAPFDIDVRGWRWPWGSHSTAKTIFAFPINFVYVEIIDVLGVVARGESGKSVKVDSILKGGWFPTVNSCRTTHVVEHGINYNYGVCEWIF